MTFSEANKAVHPVEGEWHYPLMTQYGYKPETLTAVGFVRAYRYVHVETGFVITCHTGANTDYFKAGDGINYAHYLHNYLKEKHNR